MICVHKVRMLDGTTKHSTMFETTVVLESRFSRAQFSLVRHDLSATSETGLNFLPFTLQVYTFFYIYIRTNKFWPSLIVLKFLYNLSLSCSQIVLVSTMSIVHLGTVIKLLVYSF